MPAENLTSNVTDDGYRQWSATATTQCHDVDATRITAAG
jgi:hypothetical protein